jgi:hypothetical protein
MNAIYSDNLEEFKSNSNNIEDVNFSVIVANAINIFTYLVENKIITSLTDNEMDLIQEEASISFAKIALENNLISLEHCFLKNYMESDYSYIIDAALEFNHISFVDIENLVCNSIDCNALSILKLLIEKKYISFNYNDDHILSSAIYNSVDEIIDYILPLYKKSTATYEAMESLIESGNEKYLSDCLNNITFKPEDIQRGFAQAINNSEVKLIRLFNDLDDSLILLDNNFSNLLQVDDYELIFDVIDNQEVDISVNYLDILEIAINTNILIKNVYFIDKILNHPKFDSYYVSSSNIINAINMFDIDNTNNSHDVFYKLFSIFKEESNKITQADNEILITAAKSECLEVFKVIYEIDEIQEELKESDDSIMSLLDYAIYSKNVLEFLLIEENINVSDNYEFVEQYHRSLTTESIKVLLQRDDFIITENLIINLCRHDQVEELTFLLQNEKFNTIENANNIFSETFKYGRESTLITLFKFNKINITEDNKKFFLDSVVSRGFFNIFNILSQLPIYLNYSFNDVFYKSSKLIKGEFITTLFNDKRVTDFNNKSLNALSRSAKLITTSYKHNCYEFEKTTFYKLLHSDKIDSTINDSSFLLELVRKDLFNEFKIAYNRDERSNNINSALFEEALIKKDTCIYQFLYSDKKNNIDISFNNYNILSQLYLNNLLDEFTFFIEDISLPKNVLNTLFDLISESTHSNRFYNRNAFIKLIIDKKMFDNSSNGYKTLKKSINYVRDELFIEIMNKQQVPDAIIKELIVDQLSNKHNSFINFLFGLIKNTDNDLFFQCYDSIFKKQIRAYQSTRNKKEHEEEFDINVFTKIVKLEKSCGNKENKELTKIKYRLFSWIMDFDYNEKYNYVLKTLSNYNSVKEKLVNENNNNYEKYLNTYVKQSICDF